MIKGVITDIDGVIVGNKTDFNFPMPHPEVLQRLKATNNSGIVVSLCTVKPYFAITDIVEGASLSGLQITQGGGAIINASDDSVVKAHVLDNEIAQMIVKTCLDNDCYVEIHTELEYYVQSSQRSDTTVMHTSILQKDPVFVDSLLETTKNEQVVKIMPIARNDEAMHVIDQKLQQFTDRVSLSWASQPAALPWRLCVITAQGISKAQGSHEVAEYYHINVDELLGIGDSTADWQFMEHCGYAAATGNASDELKQLVSSKGERGFIGKHVNENGVLGIFDHFGLKG